MPAESVARGHSGIVLGSLRRLPQTVAFRAQDSWPAGSRRRHSVWAYCATKQSEVLFSCEISPLVNPMPRPRNVRTMRYVSDAIARESITTPRVKGQPDRRFHPRLQKSVLTAEEIRKLTWLPPVRSSQNPAAFSKRVPGDNLFRTGKRPGSPNVGSLPHAPLA
jgi:hypothetical protein